MDQNFEMDFSVVLNHVVQKRCTGVVQNGFFDHSGREKDLKIYYKSMNLLEPANGLEPLTC